MNVVRARVHGGRLRLDEPTDLPEGAEVPLVAAPAAALVGPTMLEVFDALSRVPKPDDGYLDAVEEYVRNQPMSEPTSPWER